MKRIVLVCLAVALLAAAAFAGGAPEAKAKLEQVTLIGMVRDYTLQQEAPWTSAIKVFQQKHPNVTIKLEAMPYDDQRLKVLTTVAAGKGPDLVQTDCIWLGEFANAKVLVDLTDRLNADPALKDDYLPVFYNASLWKGRSYGLWLNSDVRMLGYHKELFIKAGLDPNKPPATWSEWRAYARKLNDPAAGVWGYGFPAFATDHTADRWYPLLHQKGGAILSADYTKAAFNSQAGVEALQFLVDLMNTDKASPTDLLGTKEADLTKAFQSKKYAMMVRVGDFWPDYKKLEGMTPEKYKAQIGMAPLPVPEGGKPATGSGGWILGITRDSKQVELAYEFLKLVVSPDNSLPFLTERAMVPTRKSLMAREQAFMQGAPYFKVVQEVTPSTFFRPPIPEYTKISAEIVTAIQKALSMSAPAKAALDQAAAASDQILAQRSW
jgi:multiple sugar transport system substrate-binding protein